MMTRYPAVESHSLCRVQGNLCRCTGYRPILEGLKTLTSDRWAAAAVNGTSNGTNGTNGVCGLGEKCCKNGGGQNGEAEEEDGTTSGYSQVGNSRYISSVHSVHCLGPLQHRGVRAVQAQPGADIPARAAAQRQPRHAVPQLRQVAAILRSHWLS